MSRRSVTIPPPFPSSPSLDGTETTCLNHQPTCPGSRDGTLSARELSSTERPSFRPSMPWSPRLDQLISPFVFPFRMSTKSEVLELCPSVVLKPVLSSLVWLLPSLLLT